MNAALLLIALSAAALPITDDIDPQRDKSVYFLADGDEVAPPPPPVDSDLKVIPPEIVSGAYLAVDGTGVEGQDDATGPTYPTDGQYPLADVGSDALSQPTDEESEPSDVPVSVSGSFLLADGEEVDSEEEPSDDPVSVSGSFLA
jgi:hypothetical protein